MRAGRRWREPAPSERCCNGKRNLSSGHLAALPITGSRRRPRTLKRPRGRRLILEPLEGRCLLATISGYIYDNSAANSGIKVPSDPGIAGCIVTLTGTDSQGGWVNSACETNAQGEYGFTNVVAGLYKIAETPPAGYLDGKEALGTAGGKVGADQFSGINLPATTNATGYNFAELRPASLTGCVWDNTAIGQGIMEPGERGIAGSNVMLIGTDNRGDGVDLTAVTGSQGVYSFTNLRPGTYPLPMTCPAATPTGNRPSARWAGRSAPMISATLCLPPAIWGRVTTSAS